MYVAVRAVSRTVNVRAWPKAYSVIRVWSEHTDFPGAHRAGLILTALESVAAVNGAAGTFA